MFCVVMWMPCGSSSMALFVMQVIEQHQEEELKHGYHDAPPQKQVIVHLHLPLPLLPILLFVLDYGHH